MGFYFKMGHYQKAPALKYCGGVESRRSAVGEAESDELKRGGKKLLGSDTGYG